MRQLIVNVPRGSGETVLEIAKSYDGANLALWEGTADDKPIDVVIVHVSNGKVEGLLAELEDSQISSVAVLLPLTAGAAGALFLVQSESSSLVSGATVGVLVAASLAPPAGLVGMASAIGRWDLAIS